MSARILVVDDVAANRQLLRAKLEAKYFDVCEAVDGHDALRCMKVYHPDIVLLDVMMPGMDGYETCRRIKSDPASSFVPVVMVTALSDRSERLKGLQAGAEDFLTKPVNDLALFTRIDALMRYNSVAMELRERQARGERAGFVSDINQEELDKPANIILVDANPYSNERLKRILSRGHHTVENPMSRHSDTAPENVDAIIISSVKQPFDPLKLCAKFRMTPDYRSISVLMIANERDEKIAYEALNLGASDIIFSPIDAQELLARVATQLRRKRFISFSDNLIWQAFRRI
ncbi:MAG: response regulator [Pseudomonadota bacterium]